MKRYRINKEKALTYKALGYIALTVLGTAEIIIVMLFAAALAA